MNNEQTSENIFMQNAYYFMQKTYLNKIATYSSKLLTVILWLLQYEYIIVYLTCTLQIQFQKGKDLEYIAIHRIA